MKTEVKKRALIATLAVAISSSAIAQDTTPPVTTPPAAETPAPADAATAPQNAPPPAATPATPPPAAAGTPPVATTPTPSATPAPPTPEPTDAQSPPPTDGSATLPEVRIIEQDKPAPPEPRPARQAATPKPKPKPRPQPQQQQPAPQPQQLAEPQPDTAEAAPVEPAPPANPATALTNGPPAVDTPVRMSPVGGSEIPLDKVPGSVGRATGADIQRDGTNQVQQTLQSRVPGIVISDAAGNGLRSEVQYRGFDASPVGGRSQGLAVYQGGVRINESFGDTVNWDIIPSNAIADITVLGSNPVYGLNAIGGAIGITMKDGFNYQGAEVDVMGGSFGRAQIGVQAGMQSGPAAVFVASEYLREDGFRDFSDSKITRFYGDLGFKGDGAELHINLTAARSDVGVTAAAPIELLRQDFGNTFTSPQTTDLEVLMPTINGSVKVTETLTFSGVAYYRRLKSRVIDGNLTEVDACSFDNTILCLDEDGVEEEVEDANGDDVPTPAGILGSIERINTDADSWGGSFQAVEKNDLFGRPNQFLVGVSYDRGSVSYSTSSEIGTIGPKFVVTGTGAIVSEPDDIAPRLLDTENEYVGVFFSNTLDVTDALSVTIGGRYNYAKIDLEDQTGDFPDLTATNDYDRFNPMVGATYKLTKELTAYAGYAEANRAPTPAELGCAEPDNPCFIEAFLTDDPPLNQVVSRSVEAGFRGETVSWNGDRFTWSAGYFRTLNEDDILFVVSPDQPGRGFFLNGGDTLRQGVELAAAYQTKGWSVYGSYAFIDATFQDDNEFSAPNSPDAEPCSADPTENCNFVEDGDRLPGIPRHRFKFGADYFLTSKWSIGGDLLAVSDQIFFGDEANNSKPLGGYARVDLRTSYQATDNIQLYGLLRNVLDTEYGVYGTFFDVDEANELTPATGQTLTDPRSITPALPFAAYGGVRIKF